MQDLRMRTIFAKMVPRFLTDDQKQCWLHILSDLLHSVEIFKRGVFNTTRKQNATACSGKQNSSWPKKVLMSCSHFKTMLVCFFDHKGIVHYEFIAQGQTVYQQCYSEEVTKLWKSVWRKTPEPWPDKWISHHDIAPAHDALRVCEFLAKKSVIKMDHPPYSSDLAPCNFWLFPRLKIALKVQRFANVPDIQRSMMLL
jgi:histone-lysine N-methyltransferase SETMAR